jgi:hypothetical protein
MGIATVEDDEAVLFGEYGSPGTPPPTLLRKDLILKSLRFWNGAMI